MKFVISTQELNYLISQCLNVVSQKATIPILSNLLLEAKGNQLTITATDLMVGIQCFTEAKILEEGSITLPAKRLAQLVRELTAVNLEISVLNEVAEVIADSSKFKLNGMNKKDFPELPKLEGALQFSIQQSDLKDLLFRTAFAVSRDDNRFVLTGMLMHIEKGKVTFIGTDGKRLAKTFLPIEIDHAFQGNFIIPLKAVEEIVKNLKEEGEAKVFLMQDKVAIETSTCIIITKLLTGEYPDINRVIPETLDTTIALHREELVTLLRQISLFAPETNKSHSVRFSFGEGELRLLANTMEVGEGKVSMPVNYHGPKLDIAFNPFFFLDILRHSKEETVTLGLLDAFNPGIVLDKDTTKLSFLEASPLFVLMPTRLEAV